jgi:hypothetical protein
LIYERGKCVLDFVCVKSDGSVSFLGPYMDRLLVDTNGYTTVTEVEVENIVLEG